MVLVIALVAIAIITVLLLMLFEGATLQTRSAQNSAILAQEDLLAESAVSLVEGQIAQAASYTNQTTWMSQPGLARVYSVTNAASPRSPVASYKLYSTTNVAAMTDTSGSVAFMAADVPANWSSEPALYVDLNMPAQTATGQTIYPIFDPAATNSVQGLGIDAPNGPQMPVAWLYELQDGTLGPASNGTAANPIVARIAFWTDDESSKININTAGVGDAWNTPRVNSPTDVAAATNQPAQGEYSAYPGHPATSSLNVVFGSTNAVTAAQAQQWLGLTPRYAWGGSQFGTVTTTPNEVVSPKIGHLYASLDELLFAPAGNNTTPRATNSITSSQLETARFVLTAHSDAPETTLLGEPRVAIWPVADSGANMSAWDRAVTNDATVGVRSYFFQRNNPLSQVDDFTTNAGVTVGSPSAAASNVQLFNDLVNRGADSLPGCSSTFAAKYPGAQWPQIVLEMTDYIHALNAVAPSGSSFAPSFSYNGTNIGCGFVEPLTNAYTSGTSTLTLRGFGRCPTLSSLTLVFYVSGFTTSTGTFDYETTPDNPAGASWNANFGPSSTQWSKLTGELVRAFVVPSTFQPGCGYPEVSDACTLQIQGNLSVSYFTTTGVAKSASLGFPSTAPSLPLGLPLKNYSERAWGGNEGPLAWITSADALAQNPLLRYPFATTNAIVVPISSGTLYNTNPWPNKRRFTCNSANLTVTISDLNGNTLQTCAVNFPSFGVSQPPTMDGEADHMDAMPPASSITGWSTNSACAVAPSWYMTLEHRLATSASSRPLMIQTGDVCGTMEATNDLRVQAALASVPAALYGPHPQNGAAANAQGGSQALNFRFADGTSACFAPGNVALGSLASSGYTRLNANASYALGTTTIPVHDWRTGALLTTNASSTPVTPYTFFTNAPCSVTSGCNGAYMDAAQTLAGDWDTGPGYGPDGALLNLPDAGTTNAPAAAYQSLSGNDVGAATQRTPNALVPSPVIFGSLPSGINPASPASSVPWRTLLFCPYPAANSSATPYTTHPGAASPPDYLLLDNFWMPVVEPYAISSCLATRGKINLNDQIAPFTYIHRSTALRALLDDLRIPAISSFAASAYKTPGAGISSIWNTVDENATVAQIENRFANGSADAYLSESEICAVPLVPNVTPSLNGGSVAATQTALAAFWSPANSANSSGALTGDNLRELPYAQLYGRLTTRSNSYTVHVWVQVLKKITTDPNQNMWNPATDQVLGEWRGEYEIERYLDPAATAPAAGSTLGPYDFRIVSRQRFAP